MDNVTHYDAIEGYGSTLSLLPGELLDLHIRCTTATYDIEVARAGGAVVWAQRDLAGVAHPTPDDADAFGCRWPVSVQVPVGDDWPSGVYLVTMRAHGAAADQIGRAHV